MTGMRTAGGRRAEKSRENDSRRPPTSRRQALARGRLAPLRGRGAACLTPPERPGVSLEERDRRGRPAGLTSQPLQPLLPPPPPHHQQEHEEQQDAHQDAGDGHQHLEPLVGRQPFLALHDGLDERRDRPCKRGRDVRWRSLETARHGGSQG